MRQNQGMAALPDLVTVYRSMEATAKDDCESIIEMLSEEHISALMVDDSAPGVPEGTYEVRVPARDAAKAEKLIDENPLPDEVEDCGRFLRSRPGDRIRCARNGGDVGQELDGIQWHRRGVSGRFGAPQFSV